MNKAKFILLFIMLFSAVQCFAQEQEEEQVLFSASGGIYENCFQLHLACIDSSHHIRYTTNGSTPMAGSTLYEAPLTLDGRMFSNTDIYTIQISPDDMVYIPDSVRHVIVIRAAVFDENDSCVSQTTTNTYMIQSLGFEGNGMAVVSICADSLALFDYETGIFVPGIHYDPNSAGRTGNYYQKGKDWERPVNVEFFDPDGSVGINQACGLRTHGNLSRMYPAKGMKIYARDEYGKKRFKHDFFSDTTVTSFKHLIFKPFAAFDPYLGSQDYFSVALARQLDLEAPQCRPVLMYLNGEYWGIYFIQEKMDERFMEDHYGIDPLECNIIGSWFGEIENGTNAGFQQMMSWFMNADLSDENIYNRACEIIDMHNFIDYYVAETFVGNWDWPGNNMRCWQQGNGPWRWIFFDGDATIINNMSTVFPNAAIFTPPYDWNNFPEAKLLFGKLLKNERFRDAFTARAEELCQSVFSYESTLPLFSSIVDTLSMKIHDQQHRFGYPYDMDKWNNLNQNIKDHLSHRVNLYLELMYEFLSTIDVDEYAEGSNPVFCYPNPTQGTIWIRIPSNSNDVLPFALYDPTGRLILSKDLYVFESENVIPIEVHLPSGLYLVKIGNVTKRLVITK